MTFPFGKYFGEIRLLADLQFQDGAKPFEDRPPDDPEAKDLLLYLGCNVLRTAHLVSTVTAVLKAMGFDFNAVGGPAYCCGIIHHMNGAREASRGYTAGSLRHFAAYRPQQVIMWCPSCNEHYDDVVKREHDVTFPLRARDCVHRAPPRPRAVREAGDAQGGAALPHRPPAARSRLDERADDPARDPRARVRRDRQSSGARPSLQREVH